MYEAYYFVKYSNMGEDMRYLILFASGVFSHIAYFARGEHHLCGALYLRIFALVLAALTLVSHGGGSRIGDAFSQAFGVMLSYLVGVFFSLVIYRLFLHPLRTFVKLRRWSSRLSSTN